MSMPLVVRSVLWLWLTAAIAVGYLQLLHPLPPGAIQGVSLLLAALLIVACRRLRVVRAWLDALDLRALVWLHASRFLSVYLFHLHHRGELSSRIAMPAGLGDFAVAVFALAVTVYPFHPDMRRRAISLWNVAGFADLLLVLVSGLRASLADPADAAAFLQLPVSLLPTFLVPLLMTSHVVIFIRLAREPSAD